MFPQENAKFAVLSSGFGHLRIRHWIQRMHRIHWKRNLAGRIDPVFPTLGSRMMVVYTNSLKLYIYIKWQIFPPKT